MQSFLYRVAVAALVLFAVSAGLSAQTFDQSAVDHTEHTPGICGTEYMRHIDVQKAMENTAREDPEVYKKMVAMTASHKEMAAKLQRITDDCEYDAEWPFKLYNYDNNKYELITGVLKMCGRRFRLWIAQESVPKVTNATLLKLAKGLDSMTDANIPQSINSNKGALENDIDVFGQTPPNKFQGSAPDVTDFLILDIKDGIPSGASVGGFFSPVDQTTDDASNEMNILYIDDAAVNNTFSIISTLAHEFQHLIHYGRKRPSVTLFNEGCSEEASILNGYSDRHDALYANQTNIEFFRWTYDKSQPTEILKDYTRAMTFVHYLSEQYGTQFLYEFLGTQRDSMARIDEALNKIGRGDMNWRETFKNFAVAMFTLKQEDAPDPKYGFKYPLTGTRAKTSLFSGGSFPAENSVPLESYGIAYYRYEGPGAGLKVNFSGERDFTVMAILYRNTTETPEVRELTPGTEHLLSIYSASYARIVLAVVNLSDQKQTVNWTASLVTLGVDDPTAAADAGLQLAEVAPNPVTGAATIRFTTGTSDPVSLRVYDENGALVRTLLDGEKLENGEHTLTLDAAGLPNGVYRARLTQGTHAVSRPLVVLK